MLKHIAPVCIAAALLMLANGCCCMQPQMCGDVAACGSCDGGGSCGTAGCCSGSHLGSCIKNALTCGAGCGDVYWGEWTSDPPASCDPCDDYGNWTGQGYCAPRCRPLSGLRHLWGYRFAAAGCDDGCGSYVETTPEFIEVEEGVDQQLLPPKPEAEPIPAKKASTGRRVRHATYDRTLLR